MHIVHMSQYPSPYQILKLLFIVSCVVYSEVAIDSSKCLILPISNLHNIYASIQCDVQLHTQRAVCFSMRHAAADQAAV